MTMQQQRGFSLVELMVGLTIGIVVLTVLSLLLVNNSRARVELDQSMQQIENGRYAMDLLNKQLQHVGFYGTGAPALPSPLVLPDPCATDAASLLGALALHVQGFSNVTAATVPCIGAGNVVPGTDVLVLRRAMTVTTAAGSLDAAAFYLQAIGASIKFGSGSTPATFNLTVKSGALAPIHQFLVHIYFVSPCSKEACAAGSDSIPTLKRLELTTGGWQTAPLSEGIDRMHVQYGVDTDDPKDGTADLITSTPVTISDWRRVVEVRVHMLSRNTLASTGYQDNKTYTLGAEVVPASNDEFKRHVYSGASRMINISGRMVNAATLGAAQAKTYSDSSYADY